MTETFRKTGTRHAPDDLRAEAAGLEWLRAAGGARVVRVLACDDDALTLERIRPARPTPEAAREFGAALARTHSAGAEAWGAPPDGWTGRCFIGTKEQPCRPRSSWGAFYAEQRVLPHLPGARDRGMLSAAGARLVEQACDRIAGGDFDGPDCGADRPARLHGDLWSGNVLWSPDGVVIIDPAAHGGHRETDLAMLALFGAPHLGEILAGYESAHQLGGGLRDRVPLHQLHPLAVHADGQGAHYGEALAAAARAVLAL